MIINHWSVLYGPKWCLSLVWHSTPSIYSRTRQKQWWLPMFVSQCWPVYPAAHSHWKLKSPLAMQVPPLLHTVLVAHGTLILEQLLHTKKSTLHFVFSKCILLPLAYNLSHPVINMFVKNNSLKSVVRFNTPFPNPD